jgi:RNA polymerase sigma-70 factor (ECF subfamily)
MLSEVFAERAGLAIVGDLEPMLARLVAAGRAAWPTIVLDPAQFVAHIAARLPPETQPAEWLDAVYAEDSYLACACLTGQRAALDAFEHHFASDIARSLDEHDCFDLDDAKQILWQRLFVGGNAAPKIATYSGRGPLRRWLCVVASRLAIDITIAREPMADQRQIAALAITGDDPELSYVKAHYRAAYARAFGDAHAQLSACYRTVLVQYYVDTLTIEEIAMFHGVHRATAARWLTSARDRLRELIVAQLRIRLQLPESRLRSITRMVRSQLAASLARALVAPP